MPDTLSSFTEAMGLIPDNTSRLIAPDDQRSVAISLLSDRGAGVGDSNFAPWTVPIAAVGAWVDIPQAIDMLAEPQTLFWRMDVNGHLIYAYADDWPTIVVPPGHQRAARFTALAVIDPNNNVWQFAISIDGVPLEPFITIDDASTTDALAVAVLNGEVLTLTDNPVISVQVRNQSNTDDLALSAFGHSVEGGPLA